MRQALAKDDLLRQRDEPDWHYMRRLMDYFKSRVRYDLPAHVRLNKGQLAHFPLHNSRVGICEWYAGAFALACRVGGGIPARSVAGQQGYANVGITPPIGYLLSSAFFLSR